MNRGQGHLVGTRASAEADTHEGMRLRGHGHLCMRTLDEGAHVRDTDTSRGHVTSVIAGYIYRPFRMKGISPEP